MKTILVVIGFITSENWISSDIESSLSTISIIINEHVANLLLLFKLKSES